ncbi:MAG: hypothetical protein U5L96_13745 [Owenweeksia sp.]|nr:hypothetical protein [Owenweeksia sp.]
MREAGSYINDKPDGSWVSYYPDGSIHTRASYAQGKKEGKWYVYSQDGQYLYEVIYENNRMQDSNRWKIEERSLLAGQ